MTRRRCRFPTNTLLLYFRIVVFVLLCAVATPATVRNNEILYIGGTASSLPNGTKGRFALLDKDVARFISVQGSFEIPYKQVTRLGYGEKVSRRIVEALTISPWFVLSKRHQHILSIEFSSSTRQNLIAIFEAGKDNVAAVVAIFENRSGVKFEFESNEAEKDFRQRDFRLKMNEANGSTK